MPDIVKKIFCLPPKVQDMPQSQTAANPQHQEEEKKDIKTKKKNNKKKTKKKKKKRNNNKKTRAKQTNKCTRNTKTSSLFPKRDDQNAKTNGETRTRAREDFKTLNASQYEPQSYTEQYRDNSLSGAKIKEGKPLILEQDVDVYNISTAKETPRF